MDSGLPETFTEASVEAGEEDAPALVDSAEAADAPWLPETLVPDTPDDSLVADSDSATSLPIVLATFQNKPTSIAVDADYVYWTTAGDLAKENGSVLRVPIGGGQVTELANGLGNPGSIAADVTSLYWVNIFLSRVLSMPLSGGTPSWVNTVQDMVYQLAIDDTYVFSLSYRDVLRTPLEGGTSLTLHYNKDSSFAGIALDKDSVFFGDDYFDKLLRVPKDGSSPPQELASSVHPCYVAVDDTNVFWSEDVKDGGVRTVSKQGGTPATLAEKPHSRGIALDAQHLYWITESPGGQVLRLPKAGGVAEALYDSGGEALAVDSKNIYWVDPAGGSVMQAPK